MKQILAATTKPKEFLERIYANLVSKDTKDDATTFGVTETVDYSYDTLKLGVIVDPMSLEAIAERVKKSFEAENFSERKKYAKKQEFNIRLGMDNDNKLYIAMISLKPYDPKLLIFNHTVNIRRLR